MAATVRVGPAGWSYDDWKGIVYPPDMPRSRHPLEWVSSAFDTVEVNSTFYRPPIARYCASWLEKAAGNEHFKFTLKLWRRFTHERDEWPTPEEAQTVLEGVKPLAETGKLGAMLVQFPWSFKRTRENRLWLGRVLDTFSELPLALEVRHASWNRPEVFDELARRKAAFCNIDQPLFSNSIEPSAQVTARVGYVRLHGRNSGDWFREDAGRNERYDYLYNQDELGGWLKKIERIRQMAGEVYCITNNHYRGQAVVNAFELQHGLGQDVRDVPGSLAEAYPRLKPLADRE